MVDASHDGLETRCRRLGHPVPFGFCRREGGSDAAPCRLLRDCWWERFDVACFVRGNYAPETVARLETDAPAPDKTQSLYELIRQAQERLARDAGAKRGPEAKSDSN